MSSNLIVDANMEVAFFGDVGFRTGFDRGLEAQIYFLRGNELLPQDLPRVSRGET